MPDLDDYDFDDMLALMLGLNRKEIRLGLFGWRGHSPSIVRKAVNRGYAEAYIDWDRPSLNLRITPKGTQMIINEAAKNITVLNPVGTSA